MAADVSLGSRRSRGARAVRDGSAQDGRLDTSQPSIASMCRRPMLGSLNSFIPPGQPDKIGTKCRPNRQPWGRYVAEVVP